MTQHSQHTPEQLKQKLVDAGLKATSQRIAIFDALLRLGDHPKAENVFEVIRPQHPSLSLGTVYKTLDTFVSVQLIRKVYTPEGTMRYDADMSSHSHIYCTNTGEIVDYYDKELDELLQAFFRKKNINNLSIKDVRLYIDGEKNDPDKGISIQ